MNVGMQETPLVELLIKSVCIMCLTILTSRVGASQTRPVTHPWGDRQSAPHEPELERESDTHIIASSFISTFNQQECTPVSRPGDRADVANPLLKHFMTRRNPKRKPREGPS
jgi:hypothetical protein